MSQLGSAQRRTAVSTQESNHPIIAQILIPALPTLVGVFPVNGLHVVQLGGGMFVGSPPEMLTLTDTPALRSLCTLLAPGLDLAIFYAWGDHTTDCSIFPFNNNGPLFHFQIYIHSGKCSAPQIWFLFDRTEKWEEIIEVMDEHFTTMYEHREKGAPWTSTSAPNSVASLVGISLHGCFLKYIFLWNIKTISREILRTGIIKGGF